MKKIMVILLACLGLFCFAGCGKAENAYERIMLRNELVQLEVRLYYEYGDPRAGQEVENKTATYTYDGEWHCPVPRFFYKGQEVFPRCKWVVEREVVSDSWSDFVGKGTYKIAVSMLQGSVKYDPNYVKEQEFFIEII